MVVSTILVVPALNNQCKVLDASFHLFLNKSSSGTWCLINILFSPRLSNRHLVNMPAQTRAKCAPNCIRYKNDTSRWTHGELHWDVSSQYRPEGVEGGADGDREVKELRCGGLIVSRIERGGRKQKEETSYVHCSRRVHPRSRRGNESRRIHWTVSTPDHLQECNIPASDGSFLHIHLSWRSVSRDRSICGTDRRCRVYGSCK